MLLHAKHILIIYKADIAAYILLMISGAWFIISGASNAGYNWQWYLLPRHIFRIQEGFFIPGPLLSGLFFTIQISAMALPLAICFATPSALLRLSPSFIGRTLSKLYVETMRNTPLLVQISIYYFVLAPILGLSGLFCAVFAIAVFEGAFASEIIRAGILAVPRGQLEAANVLGLSDFQKIRYVLLPQAFRIVLPPLTGQAVSLIKASSVASVIAVYELTMQAQSVAAETFLVFEVWFAVAAAYFLLNFSLSRLARKLEQKFANELK